MGAEPRGRHRRRTPAAWPRAWVLSLAVLAVAAAFGLGEILSKVGEDPAGVGTPAVIRPSADTPARSGGHPKNARRQETKAVDRTPAARPDPTRTSPDVRALRTSRRDTGRASDERDQPDLTPSASEDASAEPTDSATSEPTDSATSEPTDEPTEEPSDEPTGDDDDDLLPILPGDGPDQSRAKPKRPSKSNQGAAKEHH